VQRGPRCRLVHGERLTQGEVLKSERAVAAAVPAAEERQSRSRWSSVLIMGRRLDPDQSIPSRELVPNPPGPRSGILHPNRPFRQGRPALGTAAARPLTGRAPAADPWGHEVVCQSPWGKQLKTSFMSTTPRAQFCSNSEQLPRVLLRARGLITFPRSNYRKRTRAG
jgi:hypothetical protein